MKTKTLLLMCALTALLCTHAFGEIIYVDDDGEAYFNNIQEAIDDANDSDTVLVADGTYTGDGNRDIEFKGKAITVKSQNGPENCIINCQASEQDLHRGFYFHNNENANSVLQGFTITNGYTSKGGAILCEESSPTIFECTIISNYSFSRDDGGYGGGIYCNQSEALITNCTITENIAAPTGGMRLTGGQGGGIFCNNSNLTITSCEIHNNSNYQNGSIYCMNSNITMKTCKVSGNVSSGIYVYNSNIEMTDSLLTNNYSYGLLCSNSNEVIIKNCTILENQSYGVSCYEVNDIIIDQSLVAANEQGGLLITDTNNIALNNCTITDNYTWDYSSSSSGLNCEAINGSVINCIIWGNKPSQIQLGTSSTDISLYTIAYSNVQGALESVRITGDCSLNWGEGNINLDPNFVLSSYIDINGTVRYTKDDFWVIGDYHLKSQAGRWDPISESWIIDDVTSPCIDTGYPMSPIGLEPFPNGGYINMGAYGGTEQASRSYFGEPLCQTIVAGDINGDCKVDLKDLEILLLHWLEDN